MTTTLIKTDYIPINKQGEHSFFCIARTEITFLVVITLIYW